MYTDDEIKNFNDQFRIVGITEEDKQRKVLDFFYTLGKIIYLKKTNDYEQEEN